MTLEEYKAEIRRKSGIIVGDDGKIKGYDTHNPDYVDEYGNLYDMSTFFINDEPFYGISSAGFLTVNTKTYVTEPTRTNDGSMPDLPDYDTFIVPRAKFNLKYFSIDDYQRLCLAIMPNEFRVKYYDKQFGEWVEHYMYAEPEEMTKIYNINSSIIGVLDYEISFIGTRNKLASCSLTYNANGGDIKGYRGAYLATVSYNSASNDIVLWETDGNYYKAIYLNTTFKGVAPSNTSYWEISTASLWATNSSYNEGDYVFERVKTSSGKQNLAVYLCKKKNTGAALSNSTYWQSVKITVYDKDTTYVLNDRVFADLDAYNAGFNNSSITFYKAIYKETSFIGVAPDVTTHWQQVGLSSEEIKSATGVNILWGNSIILPDPNDLFEKEDLQAQYWTTKQDGGFKFFPNDAFTIFSNTTLYAQYEKEITITYNANIPTYKDGQTYSANFKYSTDPTVSTKVTATDGEVVIYNNAIRKLTKSKKLTINETKAITEDSPYYGGEIEYIKRRSFKAKYYATGTAGTTGPNELWYTDAYSASQGQRVVSLYQVKSGLTPFRISQHPPFPSASGFAEHWNSLATNIKYNYSDDDVLSVSDITSYNSSILCLTTSGSYQSEYFHPTPDEVYFLRWDYYIDWTNSFVDDEWETLTDVDTEIQETYYAKQNGEFVITTNGNAMFDYMPLFVPNNTYNANAKPMIFQSWNTKPDGSGITYYENDVLRWGQNIPLQDITLYAQWG